MQVICKISSDRVCTLPNIELDTTTSLADVTDGQHRLPTDAVSGQ